LNGDTTLAGAIWYARGTSIYLDKVTSPSNRNSNSNSNMMRSRWSGLAYGRNSDTARQSMSRVGSIRVTRASAMLPAMRKLRYSPARSAMRPDQLCPPPSIHPCITCVAAKEAASGYIAERQPASLCERHKAESTREHGPYPPHDSPERLPT
jgi:hypothetical protein